MCISHKHVLFLAEALLSGGAEGSLSSESEESDDEHDQSQGGWCFCILEVGNFGQCEL